MKKPVEILAECLDGSSLMQACAYLFEHNDWCHKNCKTMEATKECWLRYAELKSEEESNDID